MTEREKQQNSCLAPKQQQQQQNKVKYLVSYRMTLSRIDFAIKSYANSTRRSRRLPVASPYVVQKNSRLANRLGSLMTIEFQTTGSSNCSLDENGFIYKSLAQTQSSKVQLVIVHCCCCCLYLVNKATESDISRSEIQF